VGRNDLKKLLDEKKMMKEKVFLKFWPKLSSKMPLLIIFAPEDKASQEVLFQILQGLMVLPVQVAIISENEPPDNAHSKGKYMWLNPKTSSQAQLDNWLTASDMALVFEEKQELLKKIFAQGVVVIGQEKSPLLQNYHPNEETGNSFTFKSINPWDALSALVRAHESYRFPYDWQHIIRGILEVR